MQDSKRDTDVKNRLLNYAGEGKGGMISENSIETCLLPYVKQMASTSSMHEVGHLKASAPGPPRGIGWGGREEGRSGQGCTCAPWLIRVDV